MPMVEVLPLVIGGVIVGLLALGFVIGATRKSPGSSLDGWRRAWALLTIPAILFPLIGHIFLRPSGQESAAQVLLLVSTKLLAVIAFPVLLYLFGQRIREAPNRIGTATAIWAALGAATVLIARAFIDDVVRISNQVSGTVRFWPEDFGHNSDQGTLIESLTDQPGPNWTPGNMVALELISIVVIAITVGTTLWLLKSRPLGIALLVPIVIFISLSLYDQSFAELGLVADFDAFLGDIVLGAVWAEMIFLPFPFDIAGSFAITAATLSLAALLWLWGGPVEPEARVDPGL